MYIVRKDEFIEVKGDKQPVGHQPWPETPFITQEVELKSEDKIYLFSDGYADQFGGPKGKKYKYKTFKDKLALVAGLSFNEQRLLIDSEFETWKGDLEQLDDVDYCTVNTKNRKFYKSRFTQKILNIEKVFCRIWIDRKNSNVIFSDTCFIDWICSNSWTNFWQNRFSECIRRYCSS
ncbi:MAG: hypothetical protein IPG07_17775 [Crocinitomicaceae bacterium]|nr:hypothetical protein [Crocinitomicaceae bacterium]